MESWERFAALLPPSEAPMLAAVQAYIEWQTHHHAAEFTPRDDDDVDLRTYLSDLHLNGVSPAAVGEVLLALRRFYEWSKTEQLIAHNPFVEYNFELPFLTPQQVRPREQTLPSDLHERELQRLRALNRISEQLNSSLDIRSALDAALTTVLETMDLQTGWVSLSTESHLTFASAGASPPHGFVLAAACNLPPGLEDNDRHFLRRPPACHCQQLLSQGRLSRAVNVVECTRLREAALAAGDNQGLRFHGSVPLISQGQPLGLMNVASRDWQFLTPADLQFLSAVGKQVVNALERANLYEVVEAKRADYEKELLVARQVQAALLPHEMPDLPGYELAGAWRPAREMSGDFYDIRPLDQGRWGLFIGDVSGKGAAAALYMAMVRSLIVSGLSPASNPAADPARALTLVQGIIHTQSSSLMYVTVFLAVVDPEAQTLTYANAGHPPPVVRRARGTTELLGPTGPAIGLFDELELRAETITLGSGDAIVMCTDGVT